MRMRTFERPSCCLTSVSICFSSAFLTFLIEFYLVHYFSRSGISSNNFSLRGFPPYANNFVFLHLGSKFFPYKVMQIRTLGPTVGNPSLWPTRQEFVSWRFLPPEFIVCRSITYWMERSATLSDIVSYGQLQLTYYICWMFSYSP